ncbi:MAG: hypothetical protein MNPFHGCM_00721 [Gemmatimonadaceae bacterium]|nr:hypothetical protein [Gemmatimonadaceae bacterium]
MTTLTMSRLARTSVRATAASLAVLALAACSSLLEVDNPNNVTAEALEDPAAAPTIINGAENSTVRALQSIFTPYAAITDETIFRGSRDDYQQLDQGLGGNAANEYTNAASFNVNEARWLADNAVLLLEGFQKAGKLKDAANLERAYLNKAVMYAMIGDMYDDFTISDRTKAGSPVGTANMSKMYDSAQSAIAKGIAMNGSYKATLLGMSARVKHAKGVFAKLNPVPASPSDPLVADNGYAADAQAALNAGLTAYDVLVTNTNTGNPPFGFEMNNRVEITTSTFFVNLGTTNKPSKMVLTDLVETSKLEPFSKENIALVNLADCDPTCKYSGDPNLPPLRIVSDNEMRLLIAEAKLAANDLNGFDAAINDFRATKGLAPAYVAGTYQGAVAKTRSQVLEFERRVALLFMGRRLNDMYRWKIVDPEWNPNSTAVRLPGCLFPIGLSERESNEFLSGVKGTKYQGVCN